jgi:hypothetical protein
VKWLQVAIALFFAVVAIVVSRSAAAQSSGALPFLVGTTRVVTSWRDLSRLIPEAALDELEKATGKDGLTIFGPRLGEAILLPACEVRLDVVVNRPCHTGRSPTVHGSFVLPEFPQGDDEVRYGDPPKWARSGDVGVTLRDGVPVAVEILVDGGPALRQALLAKYGPQIRTTPVELTTDAGAKWTADELEWRLPDVHVQFTLARYGQAPGEARGTLRVQLDSLRREHEKKAQQRADVSAATVSPR